MLTDATNDEKNYAKKFDMGHMTTIGLKCQEFKRAPFPPFPS